MNYEIKIITDEYLPEFKKDMQYAFYMGAVREFGDMGEILPESHINRSLDNKGAVAYGAFIDGKLSGGAIVVIDEVSGRNHLDFLYVKEGLHNKGVGGFIWQSLEKLYPNTKVWETCTPYFEKRNIHFYVNKCGFHIVEFYNRYHKDPNDTDEMPENEYFEGMFRFEKVMSTL